MTELLHQQPRGNIRQVMPWIDRFGLENLVHHVPALLLELYPLLVQVVAMQLDRFGKIIAMQRGDEFAGGDRAQGVGVKSKLVPNPTDFERERI